MMTKAEILARVDAIELPQHCLLVVRYLRAKDKNGPFDISLMIHDEELPREILVVHSACLCGQCSQSPGDELWEMIFGEIDEFMAGISIQGDQVELPPTKIIDANELIEANPRSLKHLPRFRPSNN
jgi:hypothetical protein